jgi:hypothetical protein
VNRLTILAVGAVLVGAVVAGYMTAEREQTLQSAVLLASTTTTGCDSAGQLWLELYNVTDRPIASVDGILSLAVEGRDPIPIGNFSMNVTVPRSQHAGQCVAVDEARLAGPDRKAVNVLARSTAVTFVPAAQ